MSRTPAKSDFWSRRKAGVDAESVANELRIVEETQAKEIERLDAQSDAEVLEELGLPDPESLQAGDDFSGFMAKAVPDRLRRRALRQLWGSNPVLANIDGLVDYGEDFTDASMVVENMQTAYQVGKGMLKHVEEMALQEELANAADEDQEQDQNIQSVREPEPEPDEFDVEKAPAFEFEDGIEEANEHAPARRRMRFTSVEQQQEHAITREAEE